MQYKDAASGEWRGYNVDLANNLEEVLGVKLEIVDATWATLIPGLVAGPLGHRARGHVRHAQACGPP